MPMEVTKLTNEPLVIVTIDGFIDDALAHIHNLISVERLGHTFYKNALRWSSGTVAAVFVHL